MDSLKGYELLLASASPRRRELIGDLDMPYACVSPDVDESIGEQVPPEEAPVIIAARKAEAAARLEESEGKIIVSADTVVILDNRIFGKPRGEEEAKDMLKELSGRTHKVVTGVCMIMPDGVSVTFSETSTVRMYQLTASEIERYVSTGEPLDKAGAYGIQGKGKLLVRSVNGDFYNVMGLPVGRLKRTLELLINGRE